MQLHIFDAISRDRKVKKISEDEMEVEYMSAYESDDSEWKTSKKRSFGNQMEDREMVIHLFGMNADGESIRVDVGGFRPYFYVALPNAYADYSALEKRLRTKLKTQVDLLQFTIENKRKLYGYSGANTSRFVKISMPSLGLFYTVRKEFLDDKQKPKFSIRDRETPLEVYESNIDPMLRFFHIRDIKPCGWISVDGDEVEAEDGIRLECDWMKVSPSEAPAGVVNAPLVHAFWDIECYSHTGDFPMAQPTVRKACSTGEKGCACNNCLFNKGGDPIIQIGTTLWSPACGSKAEWSERHIFVLAEGANSCADVANAVVHVCKKESQLLQSWFAFIIEAKVNVFVGYNIFGFDERYVWQRLERLGLEQGDEVQHLSRLSEEGKPMKLIEKRLASSALGDNMLYMWDSPGRLRIDLLGHIKRKAQLPSYKLDSVAAVYLSGKLAGVSRIAGDLWKIKTKQKKDARVGRFVQLLDELGEDLTDKMEIKEIVEDGFVVSSEEELTAIAGEAVQWAVVKDDISPQEIFRFHRGGDLDRAKVAAYCVQDCDLTLELYKKLEVFNEAMSMANVCSVPVSYIFTRGQGIKIESLIFKDCMYKGQVIKVMSTGDSNVDSYEGAIVLDPVPGFYTDSPVGVCDFASLYPSTIISENISHDMLVWAKDYDLHGKLVCVSYGSVADEANATPGTRWTDIEFDILRPDPEDTRKHPTKLKAGTRHCRYAQPPPGPKGEDKKGSLPEIVAKLLAARKAKRVEITKTDDPFKKALLDAEQNAYKITANSLYGQLGSPTFKIRLQNLAASVTAYGRKQIMFSKEAIEKFYGPAAGDPRCSAEIVYGDTDSIFVSFNPKGPDGQRLQGREAIVATQELTEEAGKFITGVLKAPHDFEYDKTFSPFIIFSKKRYVGNKFEESSTEYSQNSMGIATKRRDYAGIVKVIYGGALRILLSQKDIVGAAQFVKGKLLDLANGKVSMNQLTLTKALRSDYKTAPAHKILAERITLRDPGNAPASGDRISFLYVMPGVGQQASKLQGERIETPAFIKQKKLDVDVKYYMEHQLMNPLSQLFALIVEQLPGCVAPGGRSWAKAVDSDREYAATEYLFRDALNVCDKLSTKRYTEKMFGVVSTTTAARPKAPRKVAAAPKYIQQKLTSITAQMELMKQMEMLAPRRSPRNNPKE